MLRIAGQGGATKSAVTRSKAEKSCISKPSPNKHEQIPWGWTTLPEGSAVKKDAVKDVIILTMVSGIVGAVTCRRYDVHVFF